jgi:hypothetical protein
MSLFGAFIGITPLALAGERREGQWASPQAQTTHLETRSQLAASRHGIAKDYLRQRLDWLTFRDPRYFQAYAYFDRLVVAGYDPLLLDAWLDGFYDDIVMVGMSGELVLDYYRQPIFTDPIVYEGAPAQPWAIPLLPGRVERVTVADGWVVHVGG